VILLKKKGVADMIVLYRRELQDPLAVLFFSMLLKVINRFSRLCCSRK